MEKKAAATVAKVTKKKTRKTSSKKTKKSVATCVEKGCRRRRVAGGEFCKAHMKDSLDEGVSRLDRVDALKFGKIDAEIRNAVQGRQLIDYKMAELQANYKQRMEEMKSQKDHLGRLIESHKGDYTLFVKSLAEKYGIDDPSRMVIDPDNGIVRDLKKQ